MAKLTRTIQTKGHEINIDSGDVSPITPPEAWNLSLKNKFVQCTSLVEQIVDNKTNIVDETTLVTIAHALAPFGDQGKNLFKQICLFQTDFDTNTLDTTWEEATRRSKKKPNAFIRLCRERGLEVKISEDQGWEYKIKEPGRTPYPFTDELTEAQGEEIQNYGFIERNNCYHFAEWNSENKICTLARRSNFTLRILFHITRGKQNRRVIELNNVRGRKIATDIETKQLTSFQLFKELTEGSGNFIFEGSQLDLLKIKNKLFEQEKPSQQIDMLGWNKVGKFFAFSNGLYNSQFHTADEHGIVTLHEKNYFIPYHSGTDEYTNVNEKLFFYKTPWQGHSPEQDKNLFEKWSTLYCRAFGDTGRVALLFGIASLFSDHIFFVRRNFPMLFLYGEGGSGKSRVGVYLQYLFGEPQPPLKLSDKANTDKARIRKLAQYINAITVLEEFINELDMAIQKTITGLYDRFGYERSNMNSMYGTETVPINSTAFITGNSYPNDDPLMQRLILMDYHANVRDEHTVAAFNELTILNRQGLTSITGWLMQIRHVFVDHYEHEFDIRFAEFKQLCATEKIIVPDRMCENYALITTTFSVLQMAGIKLPFMQGELKKFMLSTIRAQASKRDVGSVTQRFWDIVQQLANERQIRNEKEFKFNGNIISIRWTEIHGMYMQKHQMLYRTMGLGKSTMLQKLMDSGAMITSTDGRKEWMGGKTAHIHQFAYDKINIDLISVVQYWESQDARYAKSGGQTPPSGAGGSGSGAQNVRNVIKSNELTDFSESSQNQPNQPENEVLPF